jgi:hypothetical protein
MSGIDGLRGIEAQHVPGYPATGQIMLYAVIPAILLAALFALAVLSRKVRWLREVYPLATALAAVLVLPTLLVWGGGV